MTKNIIFVLSLLICSITFSSCSSALTRENLENPIYERENVKIYRNTPAWELAKAVKAEDIGKIKKVVIKNPKLLKYQDDYYGFPILTWAVWTGKVKSVKTLLELGADPNLVSKHNEKMDGETPLAVAATHAWTDNKNDVECVKLLLKYGANPNWTYLGRANSLGKGTSILIETTYQSMEKKKLLINAGADINYKMPTCNTVNSLDTIFNDIFTETSHYNC